MQSGLFGGMVDVSVVVDVSVPNADGNADGDADEVPVGISVFVGDQGGGSVGAGVGGAGVGFFVFLFFLGFFFFFFLGFFVVGRFVGFRVGAEIGVTGMSNCAHPPIPSLLPIPSAQSPLESRSYAFFA